MWSETNCEGCYYLRDHQCWYKNYAIDIPEGGCIELLIQEEEIV